MRKFLLSLTMLMAGAMAVWAQTAYLVKEPTTTLTDGTYVLVAMSNKGEGPCYYSSSESGNRLYRYDLGVDVQVGNYIDNAQYIWTIDETTTDGVQKITVTNVGDPTKAFPADGGKNQNFTGTDVAELITEMHTIGGVDYFALTLENSAIGYIHVNTPGGNPNLSYWNEYNDDGTCVKFRFYPVEAKIVEDRTITYSLTDVAGNVYTGTYEGHEGDITITGVDGYRLDNVAWNGDEMTADITFPLPVSSATITNATMIGNFSANQKWHAVGDDVKVQTEVPSLSAINEWMWAIYPIFANGVFTFKVKNIATGKFVTVNKAESSFNTQGTVTLTDEGTELEVITWLGAPCFKIPGETLYLTINGSADTDVFLATWTGGNTGHAGNKLFTPTLTYTVTISDAKAATLTTPVAVSFPANVTAGYVSGVNTETQVLEYTDVTTIPAGESVVIFGEAGTYTFSATNDAEEFKNDNYLVGYTVATDIPKGQKVYALGNKSNGVAFYSFGGTQYAAYKAYLQLPEADAQAIGYFNVFGGEGTTGIENTEVATQNSVVIFDLMGRRVETMTEGNIYIVNGKKIIR